MHLSSQNVKIFSNIQNFRIYFRKFFCARKSDFLHIKSVFFFEEYALNFNNFYSFLALMIFCFIVSSDCFMPSAMERAYALSADSSVIIARSFAFEINAHSIKTAGILVFLKTHKPGRETIPLSLIFTAAAICLSMLTATSFEFIPYLSPRASPF